MYQIVNGFTDDAIREHLQCVLDNPLPDTLKESSPFVQPPADHRAQLYARMGVVRKAGGMFYYARIWCIQKVNRVLPNINALF